MPRLRFGLRGAFLLMLVCGIGLAWIGGAVRRGKLQQQAVVELSRIGFAVAYDDGQHWYNGRLSQGPVRWLLGDDTVDSVVAARFNLVPTLAGDGALREARPVLESLPYLKTLELSYSTLSDEGLRFIAGLQSLERLSLRNCKYVSLDGDNCLTQLPKLRILDLRATSTNDDAIPCLAQLKQLKRLEVGTTPLTDRGVTRLKGMVSPSCIVGDD